MNSKIKFILGICLVTLSTFYLSQCFFKFSKTQAKEDLSFLLKRIEENHVSCARSLPIDIQKEYDKEISKLKRYQSLIEIWGAASRISRCLNDGHTTVESPKKNEYEFDAEYIVENENIFIKLKGQKYKIIKINNISIKAIYNSAKDLISYENIYGLNSSLSSYLRSPNYCDLLGIPSNKNQKIEYLENGKLKNYESSLKPIFSHLKNVPFARYKIDSKSRFAILTLNACDNNEFYKQTLKEFFRKVNYHKIQCIAIDLRENMGGDSSVAYEFIKYLPCESYKDYTSLFRENDRLYYYNKNIAKNDKQPKYIYNGKIYVLISGKTFSSAIMFSVLLKDNKLAKIIGEPNSNVPSAYGDVIEFKLPNSKLILRTTFKKFIRPNKDDKNDIITDYIVSADNAFKTFYNLIGIY